MSSPPSSRTGAQDLEKTAPAQSPAQPKEWPGKSEPGHIRPIGPAYRRNAEGKAQDSGSGPDEQVPDELVKDREG